MVTKTILASKRYNMVDEAELRTLIFSLDTSVDTKDKCKKKKRLAQMPNLLTFLVPRAGLEPARESPPEGF